MEEFMKSEDDYEKKNHEKEEKRLQKRTKDEERARIQAKYY